MNMESSCPAPETAEAKPAGYFGNARSEMLGFVPPEAARILEIGCGEGKFGLQLKKRRNAEVWGLEYDADHAAKAGKVLDRVLSGDAAALAGQLPENYFDAIVCNDVLEHLTDPYALLRRLRSKLSAGGVVVSSIPNVRYFRNLYSLVFRKNWDYCDDGILDRTHSRFFTVNSIRRMYEEAGYEVVRMEGINRTRSFRPAFWNLIFFGTMSDIKYLQFATVARPAGLKK